MPQIVFLANAKARQGAKGALLAKDALESAGFVVTDFALERSPQRFMNRLEGALASGAALIAVGGGDGTLRAAAERVAGTKTTLAVVPLGTGNAWARDLGLPLDPHALAKALFDGETVLVDVGTANAHGFVNVATVGLTSLILRNLSDTAKGRYGKLAYLPAVIKSALSCRPFNLRVETPHSRFGGEALLFVAAAGRTHAGPFAVTEHAKNDDGLLSLYALHASDWRGVLRFGLALLTGRHTALEEVWACECATATVYAAPSRRIIVDGEPYGRTPLELSVRPRALRVLVPKL